MLHTRVKKREKSTTAKEDRQKEDRQKEDRQKEEEASKTTEGGRWGD